MSKPFMCGDEISVYIPEGGCECNYTIQRVDSDEYEGVYHLLLDGEQVGSPIIIPLDRVLINSELLVVGIPDYPYVGAVVGEMYIRLTISNPTEYMYVPLGQLMSLYYTKTEIDNIISGINSYVIVNTLPATGESNHIYLVPNQGGGYDRYIYVEGQWVSIGDTSMDLSNYYTKTEVDSLLNNYYTKLEVDTMLEVIEGTFDSFGVNYFSDEESLVRRQGNAVYLKLHGTAANTFSGSHVLATVSEGFRPSEVVPVTVWHGGNALGLANIFPDGWIQTTTAYPSVNAGSNIRISTTYIVEEADSE